MKKKIVKKKSKPLEITDILEERFDKDGEELVRRIYMNGSKKIKEEVGRE